jgi:hypothetical protein
MRMRIAVPERHVSAGVIDAALEAVTRLDEHMVRGGEVPPFTNAVPGVKWQPENFGDEHFDHAGTVLGRGWGDCDDLAPWHAGSLRASGEDPGAFARVVQSGPNMYHAIVQRSDGSIDDPSVAAGMKATRTNGYESDQVLGILAEADDGRQYLGMGAATCGPLTSNPGPGYGVRRVAGVSGVWEGRADVPLVGAPLAHCRAPKYRVRAHCRAPAGQGKGKHKTHGTPYAISCTNFAPTPAQALSGAVMGAVLYGDASESVLPEDRYKLLATQGLLAGMPPQACTEALAQHIYGDAICGAISVVGGDPLQAAHGIVQHVLGAIAHLPC